MNDIALRVSICLAALLAGCAAPTAELATTRPVRGNAKQIVRIVLYSFPEGEGNWAVAHREFHPDGLVEGGHVSGGPDAPRVYLDKKRIGAEQVKRIWNQAEALARTWQSNWSADRRSRHLSIVLKYEDGTELRAAWPADQKPPCPEAEQLLRMLSEVQVGAW